MKGKENTHWAQHYIPRESQTFSLLKGYAR